MTVLVTAKDSQLGKCFRDLVNNHTKIKFIFKSSKELDITNKDQVDLIFKNHKIDYCINCAAYTAVDKAEIEPEKAHNVNVVGTQNLTEASLIYKVTLIHISTDFVFNGNTEKPYKEEDNASPLSVYGKTKLKAENQIINTLKNYFIVRTSWMYSEYGSNFLKTMLTIAGDREEINIVGDQMGSPTYAKDLAEVVLKFITTKNTSYGVYHYSNKGTVSWYDFAKEIFNLSGIDIILNKIETKDYPTAAVRPKFSALNSLKIRNTLSIKIPNWEKSLAKALINFNIQYTTEIGVLAALEAGKAIMEIYDSDILVEYKNDKSPITEADTYANEIINSYLTKTDYPIISEENKQIDYSIRKTWETCWIIDPVDGTKEFVKRNGEFTVNIALVKKGKPILGVIYLPVTKTLYIGDVENKSLYKAELDSHDSEVATVFRIAKNLHKSKSKAHIIRVVGSRSHMNKETENFINSLKQQKKEIEIISKGSSLKFCILAEGGADIYPRFAPTMEWDTAAGQAICNAIDIEVISQDTKEPLLYNKENLLNPWFIVS